MPDVALQDVFVIGDPDIGDPTFSKTASSKIAADYVPVGSDYAAVEDSSLFKVGDEVVARRIVTAEWVASMGMNKLVRDGEKQTWIAPGTALDQPRTIVEIDPDLKKLRFDYPLTDKFDTATSAGGSIIAFTLPKGIASGNSVEFLDVRLAKDQSGLAIQDETAFGNVVSFSPWSQDNWARSIDSSGFLRFFKVAPKARRVTMRDLTMRRLSKTNTENGVPADILVEGTQVLVHRCTTVGVPKSATFSVATGPRQPGPVSVLEHTTTQPDHQIQPHQRWMTVRIVFPSLINQG